MALPTTITGAGIITNPSFLGPFISAGGNVYVITPRSGATDILDAFKATDPTSSFTAQDTTNAPDFGIGNVMISVREDSDSLHVIGMSASQNQYFYGRFNMANDTWAQEEAVTGGLGAAVVSRASDIVVRSTGERVGAINGATDRVHGGDYDRIDMVRSTDGVSWTIEDATNNIGAEIHYTGPVCVLGASDRVHIFYKNHTSDALLVSTLLSNNTWGSRGVSVDSTIATDAFPIGRGVNNGGTIYVPYRDSGGTTSVASFTSADTPGSFTITTGVSDVNPKVSSGFGLHGLSLDGTDRHLGYIRASDDDLARDVDTGSGWGTDTVELTLASVTHLSSNVIDR